MVNHPCARFTVQLIECAQADLALATMMSESAPTPKTTLRGMECFKQGQPHMFCNFYI